MVIVVSCGGAELAVEYCRTLRGAGRSNRLSSRTKGPPGRTLRQGKCAGGMGPVEMLRGEISVGDDLGEFAAWGVCNVRDDALRGLVASCTCLSRVRPAKCAGVKMRPGGNAHTVN